LKRALGAGLFVAALAGCGEEASAPVFDGPGRAPLVRPDTPGNTRMFNFDPADVVEAYDSVGGRFRVHYTRQGPNAVPAADANSSGVPDFVEQVGDVYEEVLSKYQGELGFRAPVSDQGMPDNGGDGRFDVYLVDFAGQGDGHYTTDVCGPANTSICSGYMVQENDFKGYGYPSTLVANRILGSHEFFHAVQAAYDDGQGAVFAEGSAVWATETFDSTLSDFEGFLPGYLDNTDRPLDQPLPGAVDPFSYGAGIFFEFLEERYGQGTVRELWERSENGAMGVADPIWFEQIGPMLTKKAGVSFADAFTEFATWNLFTGKFADPTRGYAKGKGYASVQMTDVVAPYSGDQLRVFYASAQYFRVKPGDRAAMTAALVAPAGAPEEIDGLRVLLAVERGSSFDPVKTIADVSAGVDTIATDGAAELVVVVVNEREVKPSRKPSICIGSVDEVAACRAAFLGGTGAGGAGGGGGTSSSSSSATTTTGSGGAAASSSGDAASGCGCRVVEGSNEAAGGWAAALAIGGAVYRRRRARRPTRARPRA
jgi:MYXO-CTERM domain-containing protein